MSAHAPIGRRRLLKGTAGVGLALLGRSFIWPLLAGAENDEVRLASLLKGQPSAYVIGREYLRLVPTEASRAVLTSLVSAGLPGGSRAVATASDEDLRLRVLLGTQRDFEEGRTVRLDGWVLSVTETRLCALSVCVFKRAG